MSGYPWFGGCERRIAFQTPLRVLTKMTGAITRTATTPNPTGHHMLPDHSGQATDPTRQTATTAYASHAYQLVLTPPA